jgi:hypothetical protein
VVLINGDGEAARTTLTEALTKHYTRPGAGLDVDHYAGLLDQARAKAVATATHPQVPDTSDRRPATATQLARWQGVYRDPWFGQVSLCPQDQGVVFRAARSPLMRGPVLVSHGRWLVDWDDASVDAEPWLDFAQADGKTTLTLKAIDPDADFSYDYQDLHFQRVGACPAK